MKGMGRKRRKGRFNFEKCKVAVVEPAGGHVEGRDNYMVPEVRRVISVRDKDLEDKST